MKYKLNDMNSLNTVPFDNIILLDWEKDFGMIKAFYRDGFGIKELEPENDYQSMGAVAFVKGGIIVSFADIMKIRENELEIGAVATLPNELNKGYCTAVVCFAAKKILNMGYVASITTNNTNVQMQRVAEKLGFSAER